MSEAALGYISLILADGNCVINAANIDALLQSVGLIGNERSLIMSFMTCLILSIYLIRLILGSNSFKLKTKSSMLLLKARNHWM